jgi:hypothetical protein
MKNKERRVTEPYTEEEARVVPGATFRTGSAARASTHVILQEPTMPLSLRSACLLLGLSLAAAAPAAAQGLRPRLGDLNVGDPAPDFTVKDLQGQSTVTLSALKGKPVVLIFGSCT